MESMDKEICKNCQHQKSMPGASRSAVAFRCLVWGHIAFEDETCQHFEIAERLLPALDDLHSFLKNFDAVQERTAKSKLQLP